MLDIPTIAEVAAEVAKATYGDKNVIDVTAEPTLGWDGEPLVQVYFVIDKSLVRRPDIGTLANTVTFHVNDRLYRMGEERFAITRYTTPQEVRTRARRSA
jgi:hypothetical protein